MEPRTSYPIIIDGLVIGYQDASTAKILSNPISVKATSSELIALIGPNGAGKSTLLRSLCNIQPALGGKIYFRDMDSDKLSRTQLAQHVSLVTTELQRTSRLRVFDLVSLGRFPYGNWYTNVNTDDRNIIFQSLEQVGMSEFAERFITELSDGEFQRVMISRALAQDTPIIILDEPTAFLDLANKFSTVQLLWNLCRKQNKTIIYSTHDINIALQYADVFWVLNNENLLYGAPEDLLLDKTIERLFQKNNLKFDPETSQFIKKKNYNHNIHIQGSGSDYNITRMALERLGFSVDCNNSPEMVVTIYRKADEISWELKIGDKKQNLASIYQLQSVLRELK